MEPITTAAIASAIGAGFWQIGKSFAQKAVLEPALKPATDQVSNWLTRSHDQKRLQKAVRTAFSAVGAPQEDDALNKYARNLGFDQLQAEGNDELRQEVALTALLMFEPDPRLVPETLYRRLRWPYDNRPLLAQFLYVLRRELEQDEDWGPLVQQANNDAVRAYLRRSSQTLDALQDYLQELLAFYGLSPDVDDATALQVYVEHVAQEYSVTSFLFIKPSGRRDQLTTEAQLEAVFVPLQVYDPADAQKMRGFPDKQNQESLRGTEMGEHKTLTINDVLATHPVFLLRGKPGCGKTTLLRHVTTCFANGDAETRLAWQGEPLLPILIPLRNFGRFLQDHRREYTSPAPRALREFIEDYFREYDLELPLNFFRDRLKKGRCLVMLDGLDEVADPALRATVARVVDSFIKQYAKRGNRFALASRPKGYDEVAAYLPRPVVCDVQPLAPESRDKLVYRLLQQFTSNKLQNQKETQELLNDIRNKERVDELSRNPLFCTTLVLVYKYRGTTLPERRVDVYQELVNLMLGFWETHRQGVSDVRELALMDGTGRSFMDENEAVEAKERALIDLADWMQQQETAEVDKQATLDHLAAFFAEREGAEEKEKQLWAKGFLNVAHQRSGLFIEVEPDTYAFSHQNFREYLAATALVNRTDQKMVEVLDDLGWLPPGLNEWVRCPACADDKRDLWVQKFPLTNAQFELFVAAGGYENPAYWGGQDNAAWRWRLKEHPDYRGNAPISEPEYWQDVRFGKDRHGYPVVGVSWYEANAFANWITDLLRREREENNAINDSERELIAGLLSTRASDVRLLTETEWVHVAGGGAGDRYPWDRPREPVTSDEETILQRANVEKSGIDRTSPVGMYPQGASHPFGLIDLAGNVWEWTDSLHDEAGESRVLRGGSWGSDLDLARVAVRPRLDPHGSSSDVGFRLASPSVLGSDS